MRRVLITAPLTLCLTLAFGLLSIVGSLIERKGRLARRCAAMWSRGVLGLWGVRVQVSGLEHMIDGPAVYAANHSSALDIPILFGHLPVDFRIVHKRSLYFTPIVGLYLYMGRHVGIDRQHPFRARKSLESAAARVRRGMSLVVFPEGTRSPDARVRPFKRGSFVLAIQAGVPVVPVSMIGVKQIAPHGLLHLQRGTVYIRVHRAFSTTSVSVENAQDLADQVRDVVSRGCEASSA